MIVFDMDNTILEGRFIDECSRAFGFADQLHMLREKESDPIILTKRIGLLLKGISIDELLEVASGIPVVEDIHEVLDIYREKEFVTGIISNSYLLITDFVRQKLNMDFSMANKLEYFEGRATGEVNMPSYFFPSASPICAHPYCKTHALQSAALKYKVNMDNTIAVGDSMDDRCMIEHAGKGFAFGVHEPRLGEVATLCLDKNSFKPLLDYCE
jgi:HAD superfamily phosphoserine phosphatase-like hydrolase